MPIPYGLPLIRLIGGAVTSRDLRNTIPQTRQGKTLAPKIRKAVPAIHLGGLEG